MFVGGWRLTQHAGLQPGTRETRRASVVWLQRPHNQQPHASSSGGIPSSVSATCAPRGVDHTFVHQGLPRLRKRSNRAANPSIYHNSAHLNQGCARRSVSLSVRTGRGRNARSFGHRQAYSLQFFRSVFGSKAIGLGCEIPGSRTRRGASSTIFFQ
jgi:hypothetical protein